MSDFLGSFHFLRPAALLLLVPGLGLWWMLRRAVDTMAPWRGVVAPAILAALTAPGAGRSRLQPHDLLALAWALSILAVAGPTWRREPSPFAEARPPAMVVLRVNPSMLAQDVAPSRLERAVQKLSDLVARREGAATGLIAYSGSVHLVLPPTADGTVVTAMAQALSPEIMPQEGDSLARAVALAASVLQAKAAGGSVLVLADTVSDAEIASLPSLSGLSSDIWATRPATLPDPGESLSRAASSLGAHLQPMSADRTDVEAIAARLDRAAPSADAAGDGERWQEAGYWLTPFLALLTLAWFRRGWMLGG